MVDDAEVVTAVQSASDGSGQLGFGGDNLNEGGGRGDENDQVQAEVVELEEEADEVQQQLRHDRNFPDPNRHAFYYHVPFQIYTQ